jgi:uncharacterized membrane protein
MFDFIMFDFKLLIIAVVLITVDFAYLNLIKDYFGNQVKLVQGSPLKINLLGAVSCYILLTFGLYYFIIKPKRSILDAFLLGLIIYGVFETTNITLFSKWSWLTVFIDTLWGGILFALTAFIITFIITFIKQ